MFEEVEFEGDLPTLIKWYNLSLNQLGLKPSLPPVQGNMRVVWQGAEYAWGSGKRQGLHQLVKHFDRASEAPMLRYFEPKPLTDWDSGGDIPDIDDMLPAKNIGEWLYDLESWEWAECCTQLELQWFRSSLGRIGMSAEATTMPPRILMQGDDRIISLVAQICFTRLPIGHIWVSQDAKTISKAIGVPIHEFNKF